MRRHRHNTGTEKVDRCAVVYYGDSARSDFWLAPRWRNYSRLQQGAHMILADLHNALLPIGSSSDATWSVELLPRPDQTPRADAEEVVVRALDCRGHSYDVRDALQHFLPDCARNVLLEGTSVYEMVFWRDQENQNITAVEFHHLPQPSLKRIWRGWHQHLPAQVAKGANRPRKIHLPSNRIACFVWPKQLGSNGLRLATLEAEAVCQRRIIPSFYLPQAEVMPFLGVRFPRQKVPFDYKYHSDTNFKSVGRIGRSWGYGHRSLLSHQMGDFYYFWRTLEWERFVSLFRQLLLEQLNQALLKAEVWTGPLGYIEVKGLPSVQDYDKGFEELGSGPESYTALLKRLRR